MYDTISTGVFCLGKPIPASIEQCPQTCKVLNRFQSFDGGMAGAHTSNHTPVGEERAISFRFGNPVWLPPPAGDTPLTEGA